MQIRRLTAHASARGFSMLEVLISLVLIAFALLGMAGLQISAMKLTKGGTSRMQAVLLSSEIAERMESNKAAALTGAYEVTVVSSTPSTAAKNCVTNACTSVELASYDLAEWQRRIAATLPAASWQITRPTTGNPSTYTIVVSWEDRRDSTRIVNYSTNGTTEILSHTSTKVIYQ